MSEREEYYVYDGDDVVLDFVDANGATGGVSPVLKTRYLHGPAVDQILAQEEINTTTGDSADVLWMLTDHLGSVRDIVNQAGEAVSHVTYDAFGNIVGGTGVLLTRYLYTGRELDTLTGLQYNRNRWYDPALGRWVSEDPIGFAGGDYNLNRYVSNEPTTGTDPSGTIGLRVEGLNWTPASDADKPNWMPKWLWDSLNNPANDLVNPLSLPVTAGFKLPAAFRGFRLFAGKADEAVEVAKVVTKCPTPAKGLSVIGPRATYRQFAKDLGANFLDIADEAWTQEKNLEYLQGIVQRGDDVVFAGRFNPKKLDSESTLAWEIDWLIKEGKYHWDEGFYKLTK